MIGIGLRLAIDNRSDVLGFMPWMSYNFTLGSLADLMARGPTPTFSRGSGATQYNSNGYLSWAPENLFKDSAGPSTANYSNTGVTTTPNALGDYTLVAEQAVTSVHQVSQTVVTGIPGVGETYTVTCDVMSYGGRDAYIGSNASVFGSNDYCYYDLQNGLVRNAASGVINPSITAIGGGAYRLKWSGIVTGSVQAPAFFIASVRTTDTVRGPSFLGDVTKGIYVRNIQVQRGTTATPYVATTSSAYYGPVFDYNPSLTVNNGENWFTWSSDLTNAAWVTTEVAKATGVAVPSGYSPSIKLNDTTTNSQHYMVQSISSTFQAGPFVMSILAKAAEYSRLEFRFVAGSDVTVQFNLANGTASVTGTNGAQFTASCTLLSDGWYLCRTFCSSTNPGTNTAYLRLVNNSNASTFAGTGSSGLYLSSPQFQRGVSAGAYVATSASSVITTPAAPVRGLAVWEQRSNILTYSQDYANAAWVKTDTTPTALTTDTTCPAGLNCASKIVEGSAGTAILTSAISTVTAGNVCIVSHFIKRGNFDWIRLRIAEDGTATDGNVTWFNLSTGAWGTVTAQGLGSAAEAGVQTLPNGWYRVWIACIVNSTSTNIRAFLSSALANGSTTRVPGATYYLAGSQFESIVPSTANSSTARMTPYIPTSNAGVTRNADVTTATGYAGIFNNTAGAITAVSEQSYLNSNGSARGIGVYFDDLTASNRHYIFSNSGGANMSAGTSSSAVALANLSYTAVPLGVKKVAYGFAPANMAGYYAGVSMGTSTTSGNMPTITRGMFGHRTVDYLNGWLQSVTYYSTRIPNTELARITT